MAAYKFFDGPFGQLIRRAADGAIIPQDPANADYQEFLAWEAAGNTADPADPPPPQPVTMSPLDWIARFTDGEQAAIFTARRTSLQLDIWITQLAAADTVTLDDGTGKPDARLKKGVDGLVAAGLLTAQRAAAVLAPP